MKNELFPRYLYPTHTWKALKTADLRTATIIGYMKSGKTVLARWVGAEAYSEVTKHYDDDTYLFVETRSLRAAKKWLDENWDNYLFVIIFVDDAIGSAHSRQKNVEETSLYTDVRHWTVKRGLISILYATQNFKLLDSVMRYAQVYIWKTVPLEYYLEAEAKRWVLRYIGLPEMVKALEHITRMVYSLDPEQMIEGLRKAIVRIPMQGYGPKLFDEIPNTMPPRRRWVQVWKEVEDEEPKDEEDKEYIKKIERERDALARALKTLLVETGLKTKRDKKKYLRVRTNGRWKSLGPIAELIGD